jgi:hypothetical protein
MISYRHAVEMRASMLAAQAIVPKLLKLFGPIQSVVDLGGGTGTWCRVFHEAGVGRVQCIDHPTAKLHGLEIPEKDFEPFDLRKQQPVPTRFDLAISLEFAEHLPESKADWIVDFLTQASDRVVFSAAIPGQPGRQHINLQWPDYWSSKFAKREFEQLDIIRPLIATDVTIPYWYRQNMFAYVKANTSSIPSTTFVPNGYFLVHQETAKFLQAPSLRSTLARLWPSAYEYIRRRLGQARARNVGVEKDLTK